MWTTFKASPGQIRAFVLTFVTYATYHSARSGFAGIKTALHEDSGFSKTHLGGMDVAFMLCYGLGQFFFGRTSDMLNQKYTLVFGAYVAIVGNWFGSSNRGIVFGLWACNLNIGDIVGLHLDSAILESSLSWRSALLCLAALLAFTATLDWVFLEPRPPLKEQEPFATEDAASAAANGEKPEQDPLEDPSAGLLGESASPPRAAPNPPPLKEGLVAGLVSAWKIPGVSEYAVSYAFLKMVNYGLFFWLPYYLVEGAPQLDGSAADRMASVFDVGFMFGGVLTGVVSDALGALTGSPTRSPAVVASMLLALVPFFRMVNATSETSLVVSVLFAGCLLGGPAEATQTSVAIDYGKESHSHKLSTIVGIIDGVGALGAAAGQILIARISDWYGWKQSVKVFRQANREIVFDDGIQMT
eukprot:gene1173-1741_t